MKTQPIVIICLSLLLLVNNSCNQIRTQAKLKEVARMQGIVSDKIILDGRENTAAGSRSVVIGGRGHTADKDDQVIIADEDGVILDEVNPRLSQALRKEF